MWEIARILDRLGPRERRRAASIISQRVKQIIRQTRLGENDYLLAFCERARRMLKISEYEFARRQADRNKKLPRSEQRGAGGTDVRALYDHIREQRDRQQLARQELRRIRGRRNGKIIYEIEIPDGEDLLTTRDRVVRLLNRVGDLEDM
jgi:hypothetical protein